MKTSIRQAAFADIPGILSLVNHYAATNVMLYRTEEQIKAALPGFLVAVQDGQIVGCGSLVELTRDLPEIRSLAVAPDQRGAGIGRLLVGALVERARAAGYPQVCALTLQEEFFHRVGFATVDRWTISPKIWLECIYCTKFNACDEIAVLMLLREAAPAPTEAVRAPSAVVHWRQSLGRILSK